MNFTKKVKEDELCVLIELSGCKYVQQLVSYWRVSPTHYQIVTLNHGQPLMPTESNFSSSLLGEDGLSMRNVYETNRELFRTHMHAALYLLWRKGIMHEDIYPRNVTWDGTQFTLIDYGKTSTLTHEEQNDFMFVQRALDDVVARFSRSSVWTI